ncbi:MAG: nuclear transport factor 2 family protein [Candidatus Eremiobacteraeota bacterium]|nr:nuclear transport factor 2 family protein [Candidatus Eremiobacteraeota bacterium]
MMMNKHEFAAKYFRAQEMGDIDWIQQVCSDDVIVRESGRSETSGKAGVRDYVIALLQRTAKRKFMLHAVAEAGNVLFTSWECDVEFHNGLAMYTSGMTRFLFDNDGAIRELEVIGHELI